MWIRANELVISEHELNDFGRPQRMDASDLPELNQVMSHLPGRIDAGVAEGPGRHPTAPTIPFAIGTLISLLAIAAAVWL